MAGLPSASQAEGMPRLPPHLWGGAGAPRCALAVVLAGGILDGESEDRLRGLLRHAPVGMSGCIAEIFAVRRIRAVLRDLGECQCARIDECGMTAAMLHDDRMVRSCCVEVGAVEGSW